jgi:hypothetical protein
MGGTGWAVCGAKRLQRSPFAPHGMFYIMPLSPFQQKKPPAYPRPAYNSLPFSPTITPLQPTCHPQLSGLPDFAKVNGG